MFSFVLFIDVYVGVILFKWFQTNTCSRYVAFIATSSIDVIQPGKYLCCIINAMKWEKKKKILHFNCNFFFSFFNTNEILFVFTSLNWFQLGSIVCFFFIQMTQLMSFFFPSHFKFPFWCFLTIWWQRCRPKRRILYFRTLTDSIH